MPHGNAWQANWCRCCSISDARNQSQASATVGISHFVRPSAATHTQIHMCAHMGSYAPIHTHMHTLKRHLKRKMREIVALIRQLTLRLAAIRGCRIACRQKAQGSRQPAAAHAHSLGGVVLARKLPPWLAVGSWQLHLTLGECFLQTVSHS